MRSSVVAAADVEYPDAPDIQGIHQFLTDPPHMPEIRVKSPFSHGLFGFTTRTSAWKPCVDGMTADWSRSQGLVRNELGPKRRLQEAKLLFVVLTAGL
jgi:hypothetical protein